MTQSFFVGCALPNLNDIIDAAKIRRGSWSKYQELKTLYGSLCKADIKKAELSPMTRVVMTCVWHEKNRRRDPDNFTAGGTKIILDALVERQVLKNDGWSEIAGIRHSWVVDAVRPGVFVTLEEVRP